MVRRRKGRPIHGILLLDKPAGNSSNKALQGVKRLYGAQKAGHTGSLDPLATGMLPVCFGEATKISAYLLDADKGYEVTMKLGEVTDSADSDGKLLQKTAIPDDLDDTTFRQACQSFTGKIQQIPPMVSAIKIDGQRLYKLARQGEVVERPARSITIFSLDVLSFSGEFARLAVHCSKGTYIRSLVTDIGDFIGCGAHVTALRRIFVSPFEQRPMVDMPTLEAMTQQLDESSSQPVAEAQEQSWQALDALLLPMDAALSHLPAVQLTPDTEFMFTNGQQATCHRSQQVPFLESGVCRVYDESGQLRGLGELQAAALQAASPEFAFVAPRRVFQWN